MKYLFQLILAFLAVFQINAQKTISFEKETALTNFSGLDSLLLLLQNTHDEERKSLLLGQLGRTYAFSKAETGLLYAKQGLELSQKINYSEGIAASKYSIGASLWSLGEYGNALQFSLDALHLYESFGDIEEIGNSCTLISIIYRDVGDYEKALNYSYDALRYWVQSGWSARIPYANLASIYDLKNQLDSANYFIRKAYALDLQINNGKWDWIYWLLGNIEAKKHNYSGALSKYRNALVLALKSNILKTIVEAHNGIAQVYKETGNLDSSIFYAKEVLLKWQFVSYQKGILLASTILSQAYKLKNMPDSAVRYLELSMLLNNQLYNQQQVRNIQILAFSEQSRIEAFEREREQFNTRVKTYGLVATCLVFLAISWILWRNVQHRKRSYRVLQEQQAKTDQQKKKAEAALRELKTTQAQLIQSEKMASLGEMTAGIAHEIQNPLNFVNNFSEINKELTEELESELKSGNTGPAIDIARDIRENSEKINHHGKRAESIVKGMLQHSRTSSGQKEPTDINVLCEEYLRLAYHGLRTKDKSFNASYETHFDPDLSPVSVVPQDIGRVILNLVNNAFYAVSEKKAKSTESYDPLVAITTRKLAGKIEIMVEDNGPGIPDRVKDKIFQPFFTTKPTGQGTGLGLSLSYDVLKAHGGGLQVQTKEGEGAIFIIQLPTK